MALLREELLSCNLHMYMCSFSVHQRLLSIYHFVFSQIFSSVNLQQTFRLAFEVLSRPYRNPTTLQHTVDLFVDILHCERIQHALQRCPLIN